MSIKNSKEKRTREKNKNKNKTRQTNKTSKQTKRANKQKPRRDTEHRVREGGRGRERKREREVGWEIERELEREEEREGREIEREGGVGEGGMEREPKHTPHLFIHVYKQHAVPGEQQRLMTTKRGEKSKTNKHTIKNKASGQSGN